MSAVDFEIVDHILKEANYCLVSEHNFISKSSVFLGFSFYLT